MFTDTVITCSLWETALPVLPPASQQNLSPQRQLLINMELKQQEQDAKIAELSGKAERQYSRSQEKGRGGRRK